ncbi:uncharacterized protein LOC143534288 [Bidens hawaiensis]|uniref:uncharacterized protein LOC143534288 n=1 Tax=Bidens hawaiensis TaxID=980011 RepID=UPI0040495CF8
MGFSIGRVHAVSPSPGEAYYLRILLNKVKGPTTFAQIRTVNSVEYPTFRDACYACGLSDDDNEHVEAIVEERFTGTGYYLRSLFCTLLMSESMSRPELSGKQCGVTCLELNEEQLKNLTFFEIEKFLLRNNSSLKKFSTMPFPNKDCISSANNLLLSEELAYDKVMLAIEFEQLFSSLTDEQHSVFEEIIEAVDKNKGGVFFVYGYGGTGKTYLWKTLCVSIRSQGKIVLSVASSGIASLLLSRSRTAHSRFHIPINLVEDSFCYIKPDSDLAFLLRKTSLIIWDEAPMVHKHGFKALDRSLKDILTSASRASSDLPFGGKVIVFRGDFKQILPVVPGGSRQQIQTQMFAQWLLDIGEGNVGGTNDGEAQIEIPEDLLIRHSCDPISDLIEFVYPSVLQNFKQKDYFHERAILAPKMILFKKLMIVCFQYFPEKKGNI